MHFKHEIIGIWQRFQRNFELSGFRINCVWINPARPLLLLKGIEGHVFGT